MIMIAAHSKCMTLLVYNIFYLAGLLFVFNTIGPLHPGTGVHVGVTLEAL